MHSRSYTETLFVVLKKKQSDVLLCIVIVQVGDRVLWWGSGAC